MDSLSVSGSENGVADGKYCLFLIKPQ